MRQLTENHAKWPGGAAGRVSAKYMPFAGAEKILASTFTCERKFFFWNVFDLRSGNLFVSPMHFKT